jgi:hypothetical protein
MATGLTVTSTSNLSTTQRALIANAKSAFEPAAPDPDLIDSMPVSQGAKNISVATYARLSDASALTEGIDLSVSQQLVTNTLTLTPTEHGILALVSKREIRSQADSDVLAKTGMLVGASLRRRQAKDVIALYDTASKSIVGTTNPIDITHFQGGVAYLMTDNDPDYGPAQPPFIAALHILQISDIIGDIADPGAPSGNVVSSRFGLSADLLQRWWKTRDRLYGVEVFHSGNIVADATPDAKGAIFNREALVIAPANTAEPTEEIDNSLRAHELGIFQEWAEGERADPHRIEVFSDATQIA